MTHIKFPNWQPIADALKEAYTTLNLTMVENPPGGKMYPADHWNIAGLVHEYIFKGYERSVGSCLSCKAPLSYFTVIRCLDCKMPLCETCAKDHFGPNHSTRSKESHS